MLFQSIIKENRNVVDLLTALPYPVTALGIEYASVTERDLQPSVHAQTIARWLQPTQGRALAVGGTQIDEVLPATWARVWRIPIAGGYGAMLSARTSRLANMGTNGEVRGDVLQHADRALDLLVEADAEAKLQETVFFACADLLNLEVDLLFFDTTSTYFEADPDEPGDAADAARPWVKIIARLCADEAYYAEQSARALAASAMYRRDTLAPRYVRFFEDVVGG